MASTRELLDKIKLRAWSLVIASNGDIAYADAQRAAAQEVREQERERKRTSAPAGASAPSLEGVTPANARQWLYDKLAEIAARLALSAHLVDEPPPVVIRKHVQDSEALPGQRPPSTRVDGEPPAAAPIKQTEPEPEPPADQIIGGVVFGTAATSERIDDREFHRSVQSPTTQNWRKSIEEAEKRARSRWMG
jgi:hypothetical protein